jgi:UDP-glucose 4-epimerase
MRVLIIGGSGFLGSHVVDRFVNEGAKVTVFDRNLERYRELEAGVQFIVGDLGNHGSVEEVVGAGYDAVVHLVSTTTPRTSNESPEFDIQTNVIGTVNLLNSCVKHHVGKFIFLSSGGTVYGDIGDAKTVDENHPTRPISSYGISKLSIESYLHMYQRLYKLNYVALRLSNPYGERQDPKNSLGALTIFLNRMLSGQPIEVWGDGTVTRDFIYAGDVANAIYLSTINSIGGVYNIGSGDGLSIRGLLDALKAATKINPRVIWLSGRPFDVPRIVLDCTKFSNAVGWRPEVTLHDGIEITAAWLRATCH